MRIIPTQRMTANKKNGYALYTAIILTGFLILISYVTANLSIKELALSTIAADSHLAFYNADGGIECALYADVKNGATSAFDINTGGTVTCNSQSITTGSQTVQTSPTQSSRVGGGGVSNRTSIFQLNFSQGCAIVSVTKNADGTTFMQSKGYNSCTGTKRLERGVQIQY